MEKNDLEIAKSFKDVFGTEDKYFGEWFIGIDTSLETFLNKDLKPKETFFKQLRYLYLYLESLEILKTQATNKDFSIPKLLSREAWYCTVLLMIVGLVDQHTKDELSTEGKRASLKNRFQIVLNCLDKKYKKDLLIHYHGGTFEEFNSLADHLYNTRNFFAHEVVMPRKMVPQDGYLGISSKNVGTLFINMPHGRIFLYVVISLIRYLGFKGEIKISTNKDFNDFTDLMRNT